MVKNLIVRKNKVKKKGFTNMLYNKEVNNKHNSVILRIIKHLIKQKTVGKKVTTFFKVYLTNMSVEILGSLKRYNVFNVFRCLRKKVYTTIRCIHISNAGLQIREYLLAQQ